MSQAWRHHAVASLTRLYPFFSGCGTLANHAVMKLLAPPSSDLVWARSAGGDMLVPLDDHGGRSIFFFGDVDPKLTWVLRRLLMPGDLALDIGANLGLVTLYMSKLVGARGKVHAFEPNPALCQILESTLARNASANVKLHSVGLGASNRTMELYVPKGHYGAASMVRKMGEVASVHSVPVVRLDDFIVSESFSKIALIKLDVEGFELEVLRGAQKVLEELRPAAIFFESNEKTQYEKVTPVMQYLHDLDYEFVMIPRRIVSMKTKVVEFAHPEWIEGHDLVAAPKGESFARLCSRLRAQ